MNYFKNYLIASSLLMGCNFVVYGANDGFHWDNQRVQKGQIQDIDRYINPDEQQSMIKMLANNKIVSQNANVLENEVSLWVLDANPQHRPRQPLKHVLYVKKDNKVVAACLKGENTSSDWLSSCVRHIIGQHDDIPIHICGSWGKGGDKIPSVLLKENCHDVEGGQLYFCSAAARVSFPFGMKVFFDGKDGVLDLHESQGGIKTNAKKVSAKLTACSTHIQCDNKKAHIDMYHGGEDDYDGGPVYLVNHQGKVTVSNDGFVTQMTGKMGPFHMDARAIAWIYNAKSSKKFEINNQGIAVVINSELGAIKAQRGSYILLINSTYESTTNVRGSKIREIRVDQAYTNKTFANNVIKAVEKEIVKQFSNTEEVEHKSRDEILKIKLGEWWWLNIKGIINKVGFVEKKFGLPKEKVLGKRTYSQQFQYEDEESESEKPGSDNSRSGSSHPDASESESEDERGKTKPVYGGKLGRPSTYIN